MNRKTRKMCGLPITLQDIIEEVREVSQNPFDNKQGTKRCLEILSSLQQLEKRIKDALEFLEPADGNEFGAGLIHALRNIWGADPSNELEASEIVKIKKLVLDGLYTDGSRYKQWFLEEIGKAIGIAKEINNLKKVCKSLEQSVAP